jgi:pyruvate/2-oxoacid:ferredoxin oxidoreductase beta subunit
MKEYTRLQGRFRHLTDEMIKEIEKRVHQEYEDLRTKAGKEV